MDPDIEFIYEQLESMPQSAEPSSDLVGAEQSNWSTEEAMTEDCNELLELAAQGDIKFVRATDDGRYEMITDTEARQLIAQQNSHDIRILEGEEADAISELHRIQERAEQRVAQDLSPLVVLDPETQHNVLETLENTEYFDKNSTLDDKTMADQFMENIAFLSQQSKMDDFIICPKTFEIDGVLAAEGNHDGKFTAKTFTAKKFPMSIDFSSEICIQLDCVLFFYLPFKNEKYKNLQIKHEKSNR